MKLFCGNKIYSILFYSTYDFRFLYNHVALMYTYFAFLCISYGALLYKHYLYYVILL